jgi:uncharacterized lipoprotein YmbA
MIARIFITLFLSSGLLGCITNSTPSQTFHYILDSEPFVEIANRANSAVAMQTQIKISQINVPDYLNQPNLVLKLSNHQIKIANYHFWAENLRQSIQRVLINELNNNSANLNYTQQCTSCDALAITIDHFYPTQQGDVVLSGSYEWMTQDGSQQQIRFSFSRKLEQGGYDEAVATMRALLSELAQQI